MGGDIVARLFIFPNGRKSLYSRVSIALILQIEGKRPRVDSTPGLTERNTKADSLFKSRIIFKTFNNRHVRFMQQLFSLIVITAVCLVPAITILILNAIETTNSRIYATIRLTGGLAALLRLSTPANLKEVFAATLGYHHQLRLVSNHFSD